MRSRKLTRITLLNKSVPVGCGSDATDLVVILLTPANAKHLVF
jgi:hypothetical protein